MSLTVTIRYLGCKEITKLAKVPSNITIAKLKKQLIKLNNANADVDDVLMVSCGRRIYDSETLASINSDNQTLIEIYASGLRDITDPEVFEEEECQSDTAINDDESYLPQLDGFNPTKIEPIIIEKSMHAANIPTIPIFKQIPQQDLVSVLQKVLIQLTCTVFAIGFIVGVMHRLYQRRELATGNGIQIFDVIRPFSPLIILFILSVIGFILFYYEKSKIHDNTI